MLKKTVGLYDRRHFLKVAGLLLAGFFIILFQQIMSKHLFIHGKRGFQKVNLKGKADGVYFYPSFLVIKSHDYVSVFDNHCTHAGCKLNSETNGNIVCSCHGSTFNLQGDVLKGPAPVSLKKLPFSLDATTWDLTVSLP